MKRVHRPSPRTLLLQRFEKAVDEMLESGDEGQLEKLIEEAKDIQKKYELGAIFNVVHSFFDKLLDHGNLLWIQKAWEVPLPGARESMLVNYFLKKTPQEDICSHILKTFTPEEWVYHWMRSVILNPMNLDGGGIDRLDAWIARLCDEKTQKEYVIRFGHEAKNTWPNLTLPIPPLPLTEQMLEKKGLDEILPKCDVNKKELNRL